MAASASVEPQVCLHLGRRDFVVRSSSELTTKSDELLSRTIYLGAGLEKEKTALLCVLGAREDGEKELVLPRKDGAWVQGEHRELGWSA